MVPFYIHHLVKITANIILNQNSILTKEQHKPHYGQLWYTIIYSETLCWWHRLCWVQLVWQKRRWSVEEQPRHTLACFSSEELPLRRYQAVIIKNLAHTHTPYQVCVQSHFIAQYYTSWECYLHFWTCFFCKVVLPPPGLTQLSHILEQIPLLQCLKKLKG